MADDVIELPTAEVVAAKVKPPVSASAPPPTPPEPPASPAKPRSPPDDTLTLIVAGQRFTGWQEVRVTRGIELLPSSFVLRLTERYPEDGRRVSIEPGQRCQVMMGADLVLSGYVDTYTAAINAKGHTVTVSGRSKTQDLVDCAAGFTPGQEGNATLTYSAATLLMLAQDLCAPFGITVTEPGGEGVPLVSIGDGIPQFTLPLGQSVYETLEPIARWRRQMLMDAPDGNLVIAKVSGTKAASGFTMPGSASSAQVSFSKQERFSIYLPAQSSMDTAFNISAALNISSSNFQRSIPDDGAFKGQSRHDGKARYRPRVVISEQILDGIKLAEERAAWQKGRDYGRSQGVTVEVPLWRDRAGDLWAPNTLAPVHMPPLKLLGLTWLITEVTYLRGAGGTRSLVTLMPPEAFAPMPDFYSAFDPKIVQALAGDATTKAIRDPKSPSFNPNFQQPSSGI